MGGSSRRFSATASQSRNPRSASALERRSALQANNRIGNIKEPGIDNIPNVALKTVIKAAPEMILDIYLSCRGNFSRAMEAAKTRRLAKNNKPQDDSSSYRPLCMLDTPGKMLERFIFNQIDAAVGHLIADNQYGFRKGRSNLDTKSLIKRRRQSLECGGNLGVGNTACLQLSMLKMPLIQLGEKISACYWIGSAYRWTWRRWLKSTWKIDYLCTIQKRIRNPILSNHWGNPTKFGVWASPVQHHVRWYAQGQAATRSQDSGLRKRRGASHHWKDPEGNLAYLSKMHWSCAIVDGVSRPQSGWPQNWV